MTDQSTQDQQAGTGKGPLLVLLILLLAAAAGGGYYFMTKGQPASEPEVAAVDSAPAEPAAAPAAETAAAPAAEPAAETAAAPAADPAAAATPNEIGGIVVGDPVVAKLAGEEIKRSDVFNYITTLPMQIRQMPVTELFPLALDQVLNNKIIAQKAEQAKLESDPQVTTLLDQAKVQIMRDVYVERELAKAVTEQDLKAAYDSAIKDIQKVEEVHARHILVKEESEALDVIKKLDGGAVFEDLAKTSTDQQTAVNGGDLGFFSKDQMIPVFADAAFALEPGSYSKTPVKSQFGYHVIKAEAKRQRPAPTFEDMKPQLDAQLRRDKLNNILETWQKESDIEKFDINGKPVSVAPKQD